LESTNDRYDRLISDGDKHLSQKDFTRADEAFQAALLIVDEYVKEMGHDSFAYKIDNRGETANERMKSASEKGESNARFNQLISEGTTLEERGPYFFVNALAKYKKAKQLNYNNEKANDLIKNLKTKLDVAYSKFVRDGDIFYKAKDKNGYRYALEKYQQALRIKRGNASLNAKIEDCKRQLR